MTSLSNLIRQSLAALLALTLFLPLQARAVDDLWDFSTTASSNTNISGVSMAEGMLPGLVNDGIRALIAQLKRGVYNKGTDIASAATTNICATGTSHQAHVTGTTTITSFGTAAAGCWRIITFDGVLTLTHNATSLIIPSATNITTAAGDVIGVVSEGSGNWRVVFLSRVPYLSAANTFTAAQTIQLTASGAALTLESSDAGAAGGPNIALYRNSASPAASDVISQLLIQGEDSAGNTEQYAAISGVITDPTSTSEDSRLRFETVVAGTSAARMNIEAGVMVNPALAADKGVGTVNAAAGLYIAGHGTVAQQPACDSEAGYTTLGTILPADNTIPQNTEGDEILTVAITPTNASSVLDIRVSIPTIGGGAQLQAVAALFVDTTADALAMGTGTVPGTANTTSIQFQHSVSAASTSARTYKVRAGSAVATDAKLNGDNTARIGGGISAATLCVTEILPQ